MPWVGGIVVPRVVQLSGSVGGTGSLNATITVVPYPTRLLEITRRLREGGEYTVSVITSIMACEVATERALSAAFKANKLEHIEDAVNEFMNGHVLNNDRHRKLYNALTGDAIEQEPFWGRWKQAAELRNKIIHGSTQATAQEAEGANIAADEFVSHMMKRTAKGGP